jgi:hypothetical protein
VFKLLDDLSSRSYRRLILKKHTFDPSPPGGSARI